MSTSTGRVEKRRHKKNQKLPQNAQITKRSLLKPSIPSPYSGPSQQKVVYIGSRTPFLSAVKRIEKLLKLSDKRLVQSATQIAKNGNRRGNRDEVAAIAEEVEAQKRYAAKRKPEDGGMEEIVVKGTGKAINKVMEIGVWFQQREEYGVRLETGSVGAVDDVSYEEEDASGKKRDAEEQVVESGKVGAQSKQGTNDSMDIEAGGKEKTCEDKEAVGRKESEDRMEAGEHVAKEKEQVERTQIRQLSVLSVYVSLR